MALFDSADLLSRVRARVPRPTADEALTDAQLYVMLGDAQRRVVDLIATHCPEPLLSAPTKLVTGDSGLTYTFGTDADSANIFPVGSIVLSVGPKGPLLLPGNEWDQTTDRFLWDGAKVRFPGGRTRTFTDGPYARFISPPGLLDASTAPMLAPKYARELLVYDAAASACERLGMDPSPHQQRFDRRWPEILHTVKTQYLGSGLRSVSGPPTLWWQSADLGAPPGAL